MNHSLEPTSPQDANGQRPDFAGRLELHLFGRGEVTLNGAKVALGGGKTLALLAYLALEGETTRAQLTSLFWADNDEDSARRNLRRELHRLRVAGFRDHLVAFGDTLRLTPMGSDVAHFEALLDAGDFEAALRDHSGELLSGMRLEGAPAFEAWLEARRAGVAARKRRAQGAWAERLEAAGDWSGALALHRQLLLEDPLQERAHREVMRLHSVLGEREAALAQFERCKRILHQELGLEPLPATTLLAQQIRTAADLEPSAPVFNAPSTAARAVTVALVGREATLAELQARTTPLTLVTGEPGIGKTHLLNAFAPRGLRLRFTLTASQTPLYAIAETLREALGDPSARARFERLEPVWRHETARLIPELGDAPSTNGQPQERALFLEGLARTLEALNEPGAALVLEDLHWADAASLEVIAHLARRARRAGDHMRLLATARPHELPEATRRTLEDLERAGACSRLALPPLTQAQVHGLLRVSDETQRYASAHFSARLHRVTGGNPYFVLETLRSLPAQGEPGDDDGHGLPIPPSVRAVVLQRVDALGSGARRLLEAAALTDDGFTLEELQPATALSDWEGVDGLERAVDAQVLKRLETGYGFTHDLARQALLGTLSLERQRLIHAKLAKSLEQKAAHPARIATHLERAGQAHLAVPWRIQAAERAAQVYAHNEALEQYAQALRDGAVERLAFNVHLACSELHWKLGETRQWQAELEAMSLIASQLNDVQLSVQVRLALGKFYNHTQQYAQAVNAVSDLLGSPDLSPNDTALALRQRAQALTRLGELESAKADVQQALRTSDALPPQITGELHSQMRVIALTQGDLRLAQHHTDLGAAVLEASGQLAGHLEALVAGARIQAIQGDPKSAIAQLEVALHRAREKNLFLAQQFALIWLAENHLQLFSLAQAQDSITQALAMLEHSQETIWTTTVLTFQTHCHLLRGDLGLALRTANSALEHAQSAGYAPHVVAASCLGALHLGFGRTDDAHAHYTRALGLATQFGSLTRLAPLEVSLARCALQRRDLNLATQHLERALDALERADRFDQDDAHLLQAHIHWLEGRGADALRLIQPLTQSVFPKLRLAALALELQVQGSLGQSPTLAPAQTALEDETPLLPSLELRAALSDALASSGNHTAARALRAQTKARVLEMAATLEAHPDLKASFLKLHSGWL